jgi:glutathione S-transferase
MRLYGIEFSHKPWSVFMHSEELGELNPLRRVPTLVLNNDEVLIESSAILDYLDETVGSAHALMSREGESRRKALKICALATGLADKAVALVYERILHGQTSEQWIERCQTQIRSVLNELEFERDRQRTTFWFGSRIGHPDIAVACALRFISQAHPGLFNGSTWPSLLAHSERCESLDVFKEVTQPFSVQSS